jgi:hypothetical protein
MRSGICWQHAKTVEDFHKLLPIKELIPVRLQNSLFLSQIANSIIGRPVGLDYLTAEEEQVIEDIKLKKQRVERRIEGYQNQQKLLIMINDRAKIAAQQLNLGFKDICGYDNRLSMNEEQFLMWSETAEGSTALKTGVLGPRTAETKAICCHNPYPNQVAPEASKVTDVLNYIYLRLHPLGKEGRGHYR